MGRKEIYTENARVCLCATGHSRLQSESDRRAIIDKLVDNGGCMTIGELNESFGYSVRDRVEALVRAGWLVLRPAEGP